MRASEIFAHKIRFYVIDVIRKQGAGHTGGSLSVTDLVAVIYENFMNVDPQNPKWDERDFFVLSKGHSGLALYAALGLQQFFPVEELYTMNAIGTRYPSHPDSHKTRGVDVTTGCLGQGLSVATGIALGSKIKRSKIQQKPQKVFCVLGDGELNEGQNYEAMQSIIHYNLSNIVTIVDYNGYQNDGDITEICAPHSFARRFEGFGFRALEIDGHNHAEIAGAIDAALKHDAPSAIIAHTTKGKGFPLLERNHSHHDKVNNDEIQAAYAAAAAQYEPFLKERHA